MESDSSSTWSLGSQCPSPVPPVELWNSPHSRSALPAARGEVLNAPTAGSRSREDGKRAPTAGGCSHLPTPAARIRKSTTGEETSALYPATFTERPGGWKSLNSSERQALLFRFPVRTRRWIQTCPATQSMVQGARRRRLEAAAAPEYSDWRKTAHHECLAGRSGRPFMRRRRYARNFGLASSGKTKGCSVKRNLTIPFILLLWFTGCHRHRPAMPADAAIAASFDTRTGGYRP